MTSNPLPWSSSRLEGCTLTGALSVTTEVTDGVTIIHGPAGCSQHNASLIHATLLHHDTPHLLRFLSSDLDEAGVIFGGEGALAACIREAAEGDPRRIFVLSTCVVQTIGDDVGGVCRRGLGGAGHPHPELGVPGRGIPGRYEKCPYCNWRPGRRCGGLRRRDYPLWGRRTWSTTWKRTSGQFPHLLALLGEKTQPSVHPGDGRGLPSRASPGSRPQILRNRRVWAVGKSFAARFGTPFIDSFPVGLSGSPLFIRRPQGSWGWIPQRPWRRNVLVQEDALAGFEDLRGERIGIPPPPG